MVGRWAGAVWLAGWMAAGVASGQQIHLQTFETKDTSLKLGMTDGQVQLLEHGIDREIVHAGAAAERMLVRSTSGTFCLVEYPLGQAIVFEELTISAWVYANRPGVRIMARVVLPNEVDEDTKKPTVTLLRGDVCETDSRWRRLNIRRPDLLLQSQQQLLQAEKLRKVDIRGAYIDMILFDIHGGIGETDIRFDDIQAGPIVRGNQEAEAVDPESPNGPLPKNLRDEDGKSAAVKMPEVRDREDQSRATINGDRLLIGGRPFLPRAIVRSDAPLQTLRDAGFNTVFVNWPVEPAIVSEADRLGLQLVPMLPCQKQDGRAMMAAGKRKIDVDFDQRALCFFVGGDLDRDSERTIEAAVNTIRSEDPVKGRPVAGDVAEGLRTYSRYFDMVGVHRYPLMTSLDIEAYRDWLVQRRNLGRPGTFFWTSIQTHPPEEYTRLVYGHGMDGAFDAPVGPQPEQIKLLAYASLAAGYRGLVFSSDRSLSKDSLGDDRMLQIGLLNLELALIEPFLAGGNAPMFAKTSNPDIAAVIFRHDRGVLVLPFWKKKDAQFVLGQAAVHDLQVIVENAPEAAQAFQITLGEVRALKRQKDLGGVRVTIPEFDLASFVILTTDVGLFGHYQERVQQFVPTAAEWQKKLAEQQLARTEEISAKLQQIPEAVEGLKGNRILTGVELVNSYLTDAREHQTKCTDAFEQKDYRLAIAEAARSMRIVRLAQQTHWQAAVKKLKTPVADPFAVSFYTLPEHYRFQQRLADAKFGGNRIPSGDFEAEGNLDAIGWSYVTHGDDRLRASAMLVGDKPHDGRRALELKARVPRPKPGEEPDLPVVLAERLRVEMISPSVAVEAGQVVRVKGFAKVSGGFGGTVDGAMVWDSLGGESLAARFVAPAPPPKKPRGDEGELPSRRFRNVGKKANDKPEKIEEQWHEFVLYRPVRERGDLRIHLVLTGLGSVQFDQLSVEVANDLPAPIAGQPDAPLLK